MIAIACDHTGLKIKKELIAYLSDRGYELKDFGTYTDEDCDYPYFGELAARAVASGECEKGIIICGSGIGISIAANKIRGIRCALCTEPYSAILSRQHNDANMLALGARITGSEMIKSICQTWLTTDFLGGRHKKRVDMLDAMPDS